MGNDGKRLIAGYPVVDISVEVYYGSYHEVDSSEIAFKIASSMALKEGFKKAKPILLEPIHELIIIVPSEYMGDVMGDISTRRGKIMGMEQRGKKQYLTRNAFSEMYAIILPELIHSDGVALSKNSLITKKASGYYSESYCCLQDQTNE